MRARAFSFKGKRTQNEDSMVLISREGVWLAVEKENYIDEKPFDLPVLGCVIDGMGGHRGGEIAAKVIAETIHKETQFFFNANRAELKKEQVVIWLSSIWEKCFKAVSLAAKESSFEEMGAVLALVVCFFDKARGPEPDQLQAVVAWAGDCRVYQRDEKLVSLRTVDHNRFQEEKNLQQNSILARQITRAIFPLSKSMLHKGFEIAQIEIKKGEALLLCSDGVYEYEGVPTKKLWQSQDYVSKLVEKIQSAGEQDNYTALFLEF